MAVKALLHYALEIPDQTVGEKFYTGFGLVDEPGRSRYRTSRRPSGREIGRARLNSSH